MGNNINNNKSLLLSVSESLGSCQSPLDQVFSWNINGEGILHTKNSGSKLSQTQHQFEQHYQSPEDLSSSHCLWRVNATATLLDACTTMTTTSKINSNSTSLLLSDNHNDNFVDPTAVRRMVHLSLIRHVPAAVAHDREVRMMELAATHLAQQVEQQQQQQQQLEEAEEEPDHIPRSYDAARRHASEPLHHAEVKSASSMVAAAVPGGAKNKKKPLGSVVKATTKTTTAVDATTRTKLFTLKDTNPILFIGGQGFDTKSSSSSSLKLPAATSAASYKLRRLETHPYLVSAKNNVWTDPQTGLEYPTDLCSYLGHDLKKAGRHTLTGVGYYTKTVLNIKVRVRSSAFLWKRTCGIEP